ncbi:MAG: class I SAM-dependent methyltransferase [Bacilli bacterium]|nr:class I SAM-dependent methyltransferase [Bacilli bacterium]
MKQNIYDDVEFSSNYDNLREEQKGTNANDLIEIPNFRKLMPNVNNKSILDLGCGYGENDKYYKENGAKSVLGIDISHHMIDKANRDNKIDGVEYKVLPMEDISNIDGKFDIIISSLAFHYVENFGKLIKDISGLLNSNGYLVFSQEHPFTTCIKYTDNVKKGYIMIDDKYFGLFSDYNRSGLRTKEWFGKEVIKYHRNFEEIINTLIKNDFIIDKILEPKPTSEIIEKNPKYINQWDRPFFLFIRARKS